ncbi:MAG: efflux RND transporter periplasmic adaptor subunit [Chitinophagaceae bacterium]
MIQKIVNFIAFTIAVTIVVSCSGKKQAENDTVFSAEAIAVKTAPVKSNDAPSVINATGLLTTANEARYAFKIGGVIEKVHVSEGQFFKRGQLLATLKLTEINAQLSQASLAFEKVKRDYSRTENLYKDSVATLEQLQNAKTGVDIAAKTVDAVAFNKKFAYIYAEADGFVTKKISNEGEVVAAGSPVLAINETSGGNDWTLKLGVTDKEWPAIAIGKTASVTIDAFPGKTFSATVFRKSQAADQNSGSLEIELKLDMNGSKPAIGMFARAIIRNDAQKILPAIPYDALIEADGNNAFVFVPDSNSKVKRIPVTIESFDNRQVYIKSGLENIQEVIVSNSAFLNEKSIINIIK